ncbi:serine/threonine-protein kinase [Limnoglobus roseus]|uniref:Tetratricopeptide repeat protein n=1 Tax=Limnoglobus roseus TaxID=2598579 RepID=A0A5C1A4W1_9BACT|nr:serine/threonine-protein kinase [Limnoglobus roseus]QEL13373.1 tetratricopeptide repeat protein [Limnoglobus roseus]
MPDPTPGPSGTIVQPDPSAPYLSGQRIGRLPEVFGRYRILRILGRGGMGEVYLAFDQSLERQVALKIPVADGGVSPDDLERFHREARAAAGLGHPNICPVHDVGQVDGVTFFTMAYIDGASLAQRMQEGRFSVERAITLIHKLAQALDLAHRTGIVHRDLKPANILMNAAGEPLITDFGLVRRTDPSTPALTKSGAILGTPTYMSPEQIDSKFGRVGPASDLYSLGVILYELLTGVAPFQGSLTEILYRVVYSPPARPTDLCPDVSSAVEAVVLKALAKNPSDRFPTMAAFAEALVAARNAPPESHRATTTLQATQLNLPPNPVPGAGATQSGKLTRLGWVGWGVAVVALGLAIYAFTLKRPATESAASSTTAAEAAKESVTVPPDAKKGPLSEQALLSLLQLGVAENAIVDRFEQGGLAYKPEGEAADRLKAAGASERLLRIVQGAKPLARAKRTQDQVLLDILDAKKADDGNLEIVLAYFNPTNERVMLFNQEGYPSHPTERSSTWHPVGSWFHAGANATLAYPPNLSDLNHVARTKDGRYLASLMFKRVSLAPQSTSEQFWIRFNMPPADVKKLTLHFLDVDKPLEFTLPQFK